MIIRLFIALFILNTLAFVVRAEASERVFDDPMKIENVHELQEQMSGDFERKATRSEMMAALGTRLLSLSLSASSRSESRERTYASQQVRPDHGIVLLNEGASLNLKWNF